MNTNRADLIRLFSELRSRLIRSCLALLVVFFCMLYYADQLYAWFAYPLLKILPQGHFIATKLTSPFFVPFQLVFFISMLITMPYFLYQLWIYISPALYRHEKRFIWPPLLMSIILFYMGVLFAYFVILPMLFHFFVHITPHNVLLSPDMHDYLDFTTKLLLLFGLIFEIPIVMIGLSAKGIVSRIRLTKMRSYALLGAFILGMLFAPPDVLSQTLLAVPIYLLYEIGLLMSRWYE